MSIVLPKRVGNFKPPVKFNLVNLIGLCVSRRVFPETVLRALTQSMVLSVGECGSWNPAGGSGLLTVCFWMLQLGLGLFLFLLFCFLAA